jgi:hypothetical protein
MLTPWAIHLVVSPALAAWLAWRRRWKGAAYGLGALAVAAR